MLALPKNAMFKYPANLEDYVLEEKDPAKILLTAALEFGNYKVHNSTNIQAIDDHQRVVEIREEQKQKRASKLKVETLRYWLKINGGDSISEDYIENSDTELNLSVTAMNDNEGPLDFDELD